MKAAETWFWWSKGLAFLGLFLLVCLVLGSLFWSVSHMGLGSEGRWEPQSRGLSVGVVLAFLSVLVIGSVVVSIIWWSHRRWERAFLEEALGAEIDKTGGRLEVVSPDRASRAVVKELSRLRWSQGFEPDWWRGVQVKTSDSFVFTVAPVVFHGQETAQGVRERLWSGVVIAVKMPGSVTGDTLEIRPRGRDRLSSLVSVSEGLHPIRTVASALETKVSFWGSDPVGARVLLSPTRLAALEDMLLSRDVSDETPPLVCVNATDTVLFLFSDERLGLVPGLWSWLPEVRASTLRTRNRLFLALQMARVFHRRG